MDKNRFALTSPRDWNSYDYCGTTSRKRIPKPAPITWQST